MPVFSGRFMDLWAASASTTRPKCWTWTGTPSPGLCAAGLDACTIYGDSYPFILPGNTMGFTLNTGRIAGENAAAL